MRLSRLVNFIDLPVAVIVLVALLLPAREMYAGSALKGPQSAKAIEAEQLALGLAEARTMAHPGDGAAIDDLSRKLGAAGFKDWAIEVAMRGSEHARQSPDRWRALLATSVAYVDRLDVVPALDYANQALAACDRVSAGQPAACPSWEQVRMALYQQHLDAGVKSGVDPHRGLAAIKAFRRAGESGLRQIHLGGRDVEPPAASSGSTGSSAGSSAGSSDRPAAGSSGSSAVGPGSAGPGVK
jgi:hypothetical protein